MDLMDLHSLVTVVREKSISKASRVLHLSQPALTIRLQKLEQELGFVILERTRSGCILPKMAHRLCTMPRKPSSK